MCYKKAKKKYKVNSPVDCFLAAKSAVAMLQKCFTQCEAQRKYISGRVRLSLAYFAFVFFLFVKSNALIL